MAKFEKEEKDFFPNNLKKIRIEKGFYQFFSSLANFAPAFL